MKKMYTPDEADRLEKKMTVIFTSLALIFGNACLPALVVGGVLWLIFGR